MGYSIKRVDKNQSGIVKRFRDLGCNVCVTASLVHGVPDLVVAMPRWLSRRILVWVEIKDGSKPPSQRKLTPDEQKFHDHWENCVYIINSEDEAEFLVRSLMGDDR